jgi:hypothetical protein
MSNFTNLQEQFTNKENLNLLWNVLLDEFNINNSNKNLINNIKFVFESNINPFILRANQKSNIMELNKQFLSQLVLAVNKLFPNFKSFDGINRSQEQNMKRITISDEELLNESYKIEDIQASRQSEFDKNVEQKRIDMENYMTPRKPKELDFSDKNTDNKITSMDYLVAEKMAQRNLEIEQLEHINTTVNTENWLTPKETSVKNEKILFEKKNSVKNNENNRLRHISIDSNNITLLNNEAEIISQPFVKKVSWDDDLSEQKEPTMNIFNKLKKQTIETNQNQYKDQDKTNNEIRYVEQISMTLPDVKQEEIIRNKSTLSISNNDPVLPKTEIIKQLNDMNKKIDNLYDIVLKLTSFIEKNNNEKLVTPEKDLYK